MESLNQTPTNEYAQTRLARECLRMDAEALPVHERDGRRLRVVGGSYLNDGMGLCVDAIDLESGERIREKHLDFYLSLDRATETPD